MLEAKLKPCPFCGNEEVRVLYIDDLGITRYVETNNEDDFEKSPCYIHCYNCDMDFYAFSDIVQETIEAWNRRADGRHR